MIFRCINSCADAIATQVVIDQGLLDTIHLWKTAAAHCLCDAASCLYAAVDLVRASLYICVPIRVAPNLIDQG